MKKTKFTDIKKSLLRYITTELALTKDLEGEVMSYAEYREVMFDLKEILESDLTNKD